MKPLSFKLEGKSILVTGSNRGLGKSIAENLANAGASVGITYSGGSEKSEGLAREVVDSITKNGGKAILIPLDVSNEEQCKAAITRMTESFGGLYGLVNNAGVAIDQLIMRYKSEDWDKLMNINLKGAFLLSKAAMKPMMRSEGGASIVNMSSVVGLMGNAGQSVYAASKAGLIGFTKSLAREVASRQIRVNAIAPGFIETEMTDALSEDQKKALSSQIALGTLGKAEDIAYGTLYLLSPLSQYVTGQVLSINGGLYM
jgi:3-oxoacyl-[acyl-carrier protein] reductase